MHFRWSFCPLNTGKVFIVGGNGLKIKSLKIKNFRGYKGETIVGFDNLTAFVGGTVSYYHDRYGLEADAVLHLRDGRYALIEIKLGSNEIEEGAAHLNEIEKLVAEYNVNEKQAPLRSPDLKIILTGTPFGYKREDSVFVIPIGCLKN